MSTTVTEAIRKTVLVDFTPEEAFELFTARIATWWPVSTHSYGGDEVKDVVFELEVGGRVYEVTDDGEQDWARVARAGSRRHRLLLEWLIGEASGTEVEVRSRPKAPARGSCSSTAASASRIRAGTTTAAGTCVLATFAESASRKA